MNIEIMVRNLLYAYKNNFFLNDNNMDSQITNEKLFFLHILTLKKKKTNTPLIIETLETFDFLYETYN